MPTCDAQHNPAVHLNLQSISPVEPAATALSFLLCLSNKKHTQDIIEVNTSTLNFEMITLFSQQLKCNNDIEVLGDVREHGTHTVRKCQLMVANRMPTKHSRTARMMMTSWKRGGLNNRVLDKDVLVNVVLGNASIKFKQ